MTKMILHIAAIVISLLSSIAFILTSIASINLGSGNGILWLVLGFICLVAFFVLGAKSCR